MKTTYSCPHCHKIVKDLKGHIRKQHPDKAEIQPAKPKGKQLEIKKPKTKNEPETKEYPKYHCLGCGELVSKGENPCHSCGEQLEWSQVE